MHVEWQGEVLAKSGNTYKIQLFSWNSGDPTNIVELTSSELEDRHAVFYADTREMRRAYDTRLISRWEHWT